MKKIFGLGLILLAVGTAQAAHYYVRYDGSATKAGAVGPKTSATQCMNMSTFNASTFSGGDTVEFSKAGGSFDTTMVIPSASVTYLSTDSATIDVSAIATSRQCVYNVGRANVSIKGVWTKGGGGAQCFRFENASTGNIVDSCVVISNYGSADAGNQHDGFSLDGTSTVTFNGCVANGCRESSAPFSGSHQGVTAHTTSSFTWNGGRITDCTQYSNIVNTTKCYINGALMVGCRGLGVTVGGGCTLTVANSTIAANGVYAITVNATSQMNITGCTIYDTAYAVASVLGDLQLTNNTIVCSSPSAVDYVGIGASTGMVTATGNTIYAGSNKSFFTNGPSFHGFFNLQKNRFYGDSTRFLQPQILLDSSYVIGNLIAAKYNSNFIRFYDNWTGVHKIYRNTFFKIASSMSAGGIYIPVAATGTIYISGNIFYGLGTSFATTYVTSRSYNDYYNSSNAGGTGSITSNPAFIDTINCRIPLTSPCFGTGVALTGFTSDFFGNTVPNSGATYSIGWYEPAFINIDSIRTSTKSSGQYFANWDKPIYIYMTGITALDSVNIGDSSARISSFTGGKATVICPHIEPSIIDSFFICNGGICDTLKSPLWICGPASGGWVTKSFRFGF